MSENNSKKPRKPKPSKTAPADLLSLVKKEDDSDYSEAKLINENVAIGVRVKKSPKSVSIAIAIAIKS